MKSHPPSPEMNTNKLLSQILDKIVSLTQDKKKSLVVFDLDSTLFDVSPRLERILRDFADNPQNQIDFPDATKILKTLKTERADWGIIGAMTRAGLHLHSAKFHQEIKSFWIKSFFSSPYLHHDRPFEGAVKFAQSVSIAGADIVYLTGRDQPRMEHGSREVLQKWGFPLSPKKAVLELKPHQSMDDGLFKKNWFLEVGQETYEKIWFFENEPVNVNLIRESSPEVEIIFFESTHCGEQQPPGDIPRILHFLIDEETNRNE